MTMPLRQLSLTDEPGLFEDVTPRVVARTTVQKPPVQKAAKSETAHRTISEVAQEFGIPQHVLRFWETRFTQLKPLKRGGGRRYYRTEDVTLIRTIHSLLYGQGYTIRGAQKMLKDKAAARPVEAVPVPASRKIVAKATDESRAVLTAMLAELKTLRALV